MGCVFFRAGSLISMLFCVCWFVVLSSIGLGGGSVSWVLGIQRFGSSVVVVMCVVVPIIACSCFGQERVAFRDVAEKFFVR